MHIDMIKFAMFNELHEAQGSRFFVYMCELLSILIGKYLYPGNSKDHVWSIRKYFKVDLKAEAAL